jgi:AcrR family transcriptional regulator
MVSSPRSGRRPGASATREAILDAAQEGFIDHGYGATTIRAVAKSAGVDPALVMHFFGNKEGLFEEAMRPLFNRAEAFRALLEMEPSTAGKRLIAFFLATWDSSADTRLLIGIIRSAVSEELAGRIAREHVLGALQAALEYLGADDAAFRAGMISGQLMGLAFARYVLKAPAVANASHEQIINAVGPSLQRYITGDLGEERARD